MNATTVDRREVVRVLLMLPLLATGSCRRGTWITRERVCAHVYRPRQFVPQPLQETSEKPLSRRKPGLLTMGLPELVLCTMARAPLELLPYFWPLTELEIKTLQSSIGILWAADLIESDADVQQLRHGLDRVRTTARSGAEHAVVLFTMNDYTRQWAAAVAAASREGGADEMVVFKDPTIPPYLCDHPALQKGFRRPPP